jgi:hypothetical protein
MLVLVFLSIAFVNPRGEKNRDQTPNCPFLYSPTCWTLFIANHDVSVEIFPA